MRITVTYKCGTVNTTEINYLHFEDGCIYFTRKMNPAPVFQEPTKIHIENIAKFDVEY